MEAETTLYTDSDLFLEMLRRRVWLIRLYVWRYDVDAAELCFENGPSRVVAFEHHRCNCEYCDIDDDGGLAFIDDDDAMLVYLDALMHRKAEQLIEGSGEITINADLGIVACGRVAAIPSPTPTNVPYRFLRSAYRFPPEPVLKPSVKMA